MNLKELFSEKLPSQLSKDKVQDALRLALQSAVATAVTFTVMKSFNLPEMFLGILSSVLIVEPSLGNTIEHAKGRIAATLLGSLIGFGFIAIIPWGFGTVVSLVVTMLIMNAIASYRPNWRYGVVAAVAISLGSESDALNTSLDRLIALSIGVAIGLLTAAVVWRQSAQKRANNYIRKALNDVNKRLDVTYKDSVSDEDKDADSIANQFHSNLGMAKKTANNIKFLDNNKVLEQIHSIEKLYNSILILDRVSNNTDASLLSNDAGIEQDTEEIKENAYQIIKSLVNKESIDEAKMNTLKKLTSRIKEDVNAATDDVEKNIFRHTFVFGLHEIYENLQQLNKLFSEE